MKEPVLLVALILVIFGFYVAIAAAGAKRSECKMEAIRAGAAKEIIELYDKE